jgi:serine/threonine protein kinase
MEYAEGGSLTGYVAERWQHAQHAGLFLTEDEARYLFRQFIEAVEYCHGHCVAHRDLKLDNTLLDAREPPTLKLCDFGFAKTWARGEDANMFTHIGTPVYMSPELINSSRGGSSSGSTAGPGLGGASEGSGRGENGATAAGVAPSSAAAAAPSPSELPQQQPATAAAASAAQQAQRKGYDGALADVWASGVLLIVMLLGTFPFDHTEHPDPNTSEAHLEVWLQQVRQPWSGIPHIKAAVERLSPEARDLLNRIFVVDDRRRISVPEIKAHPWYTRALSPRHAAAEARVRAEQASLEARVARARASEVAERARSEQLARLVEAASTRARADAASGPATAPLVRIDLSRKAVQQPAVADVDAAAAAAGAGAGAAAAVSGSRASVEMGIVAEGDNEGEES